MKSASEIREIVRLAGVNADVFLTPDEAYVLPTREFISGDFAIALAKLFFSLNVNTWKAEEDDCDDFSRGAAWWAQVLHTRTGSHPGTALAFGEFWYMRDSGNGHAINCFVTEENGEPEVLFFEPQTGQLVELSKLERDLCTLVRF